MLSKPLCPGLLLTVSMLAILGFARVQGQGAAVEEGKPAPKVELPAVNIATALPDQKDAKTLSLDTFRGKKNVVLFFYPKALTSG